jgi:hypothetical protein
MASTPTFSSTIGSVRRRRRSIAPKRSVECLVVTLRGHGSAAPNDLAKWAGMTLGDARSGFAEITDEVLEHRLGVGLRDTFKEVSALPPRLLGAFDPLLHGWLWRAPFPGDHVGVVTVNGIFHPVALVEGRVVATWRLTAGAVVIDPLEELGRRVEAALCVEGLDVVRFLASS